MKFSSGPSSSLVCVASILLFGFWKEVFSTDIQDELRITYPQKQDLDKLREKVSPYLQEGWMKEDLFLIRWLRATKFDVDEANKKILENLKWRKEFKVGTIMQENFADMAADFPYVSTTDKQGQPVIIAFAGEWDVRSVALTGRVQRVLRYEVKWIEWALKNVHKLQLEGQNVTRINLIIDLDGFNLPQHGCVQCLFRYLEFISLWDKNYPGVADHIVFLNAPPAVTLTLDLVRRNANGETLKAMKVFNRDRNVWQKELFSFIDKDKLPKELGGTLDRADMQNDSHIK